MIKEENNEKQIRLRTGFITYFFYLEEPMLKTVARTSCSQIQSTWTQVSC